MVIDLRSDTFTMPSQEMLETILTAELGDDVWREDPTVIELEALAAKKLGKEEGLLVTSGTQGNLVSNMTHLSRGDGVILEAECHTYLFEAGGITAVVGAYPFLVKGKNGVMDPKDVEEIVARPYNVHFAQPKLLCLENTHNTGGGKVVPKENIDALAKIAHENEVAVHIDGARIFNAAVASGTPASKLVENADSVQICLSKGLGCPVGSLIVGSEEFIHKARKNRKIVGGSLRQSGIIAAPGIYALNNMIERLADDHLHAKLIANELEMIPNIQLRPVETNLIIADLSKTKWTAPGIAKEFENKGIKVSLMGEHLFRMVTYLNISRSDVDTVVAMIPEVFQ